MDLPSYISGYVDGEGCFTISFSRRAKMRGGWEVRPSFSVSQNVDRGEVLHRMVEFFGCGGIRPDRSDRTIKFEVRSIEDLMVKVIPHFRQYPLQSSKQGDVERFAAVCELVQRKAHLTPNGFHEIVELAVAMNPSGRRKFQAVEMLGDRQRKVIVSTSRNGGAVRSSDPHEGRNDLGTVSTGDPAKLNSL